MRRTLKTTLALGLAAAMVLGSAGTVEAKRSGRKPNRPEKMVAVEKTVVTGGSITVEKPVVTGGAIVVGKPGKPGRPGKPANPEQEIRKELKAKAACNANGKIKVKFNQKVEWSEEAAATLTDAEGTAIEVTLSKMGKKSAVVEGEGMVIGNTYTLVINGVKKQSDEEFGSITVEFKAKKLKSKCRVKKFGKKIKAKKRNVIRIKFKGKVQTKDAEVTVTGEEGNEYTAEVKGKSKGSIKVAVKGLEKNEEYTVTVTGVKTKKEKNYASVSTTFTTKKK